jgi:hypothetical protein
LWRAVLADFDLEEHESSLLLQACRTADALDALQELLDTEGPMSETSQGPRVHPALVELRQQRIALARLLAALRIPSGEGVAPDSSGRRAQPRAGVRGVYSIGGGAS